MYRCCNKKCCTCNNEEVSPIDESCMDVHPVDGAKLVNATTVAMLTIMADAVVAITI